MTAARYALALAALAVINAPLAVGAWRAAGRLRPGAERPERLLGAALLGIAAAIVIAEILGTFGGFRLLPYAVACAAAGGLAFVACGTTPTPPPR